MTQKFVAYDLELHQEFEIGQFLNYYDLSNYADYCWEKDESNGHYIIGIKEIDELIQEIYKDVILINTFSKNLQLMYEDNHAWPPDTIFTSKFFRPDTHRDTFMNVQKLLYLYGLLQYIKYRIEYLGAFVQLEYIEI